MTQLCTDYNYFPSLQVLQELMSLLLSCCSFLWRRCCCVAFSVACFLLSFSFSVVSLLLSCCCFCGIVAVVMLLFLWYRCCCHVAVSVVSLLLSCCCFCGIVAVVMLLFLWYRCCCHVAVSVASLLLSCCCFCGVVAVVMLLFLWRCCCCRVAFSVVSLLLSCCFLYDSLCQSLAPFAPTHFLNNRCLAPESMKLTTVFIQGTYPSYQINFYEITNCIFALCCVVSVIGVRLDVSKSIHRQPLPTYVSLSNVTCHRLTVTIKRVM